MQHIYFVLALFLSLSTLNSTAQSLDIPNGNFESWIATPQFTLDPEFWETDNGQVILSTYQDSVPFEGVWGMRVTPIPNGIGEEGHARIEIPTAFIPPSLDFHVKYERTATCGVGVTVTFYNEEEYVYGNSWFAEDLESDWTPISIELSQIEPIMTHVIIDVSVFIGDFAPGEGWIAVDAMSFDGATGVDDLSSSSVGLYPNPVSETLYIQAADSRSTYAIYDTMGKLLDRNIYRDGIDVSRLPSGQYFIEVLNADGVIRRSGFVVE